MGNLDRAFDAWASESNVINFADKVQGLYVPSTYDRNSFYIRSVNKHDHGEMARMKMPEATIATVSGFISSGKLPMYKNFNDAARDSIVHRMHDVGEMVADEEILEWVEVQRMKAELDGAHRQREEYDDLVKTHDRNITDAAEKQDMWSLKNERSFLVQNIERIREPYKERLIKLLDKLDRIIK